MKAVDEREENALEMDDRRPPPPPKTTPRPAPKTTTKPRGKLVHQGVRILYNNIRH